MPTWRLWSETVGEDKVTGGGVQRAACLDNWIVTCGFGSLEKRMHSALSDACAVEPDKKCSATLSGLSCPRPLPTEAPAKLQAERLTLELESGEPPLLEFYCTCPEAKQMERGLQFLGQTHTPDFVRFKSSTDGVTEPTAQQRFQRNSYRDRERERDRERQRERETL